jgi:hypothetical protein
MFVGVAKLTNATCVAIEGNSFGLRNKPSMGYSKDLLNKCDNLLLMSFIAIFLQCILIEAWKPTNG